MTSIMNLFSNFDDLNKQKSVTDTATNYNKNQNSLSLSLNQGTKFKKFQKRIKDNLEKTSDKLSGIEAFTQQPNTNQDPSITNQTLGLLQKTNISKTNQQTIQNLKNEYENTLKQYQDLLSKVNGNTTDYINRISSKNPYLGKVIQLQGGALFYVTNQGVAKNIPDMNIYAAVSGKNGFPAQGQFTTVSIPWSDGYTASGATIPTNPPLITGTPVKIGQSVGNEGVNVFVNTVMNNPKATYKGCYTDSVASPSMTFIGEKPKSEDNSANGTYTFNACQQAAIDGGYKYFALQNVNKTTSKGYCAVSNDENLTKNSIAYTISGQTPLWNTNTAGQNGNSASFDNGSLSVNNSAGTAVFSTPNSTPPPNNYIGCYKDRSNRAMNAFNKGRRPYNNTTCQQAADSIGATYYGLQSSNTGKNAQCFTSNNLDQSKKYGVAKNCTKIKDGTWSGGDWSNAIYTTDTPETKYFLILQDDGNMCIYLGSSPNDNQGGIWCSMTNGKQQQGNPKMVASKNKFGQNWMPSDSILYPGEFLSSTKGDLVLIMQTDGNLVLYTYQTGINCQPMADGNIGGGVEANSLYDLSNVGFPSNMASLAYIDQNAELHQYPSSNTKFSNTYTELTATDSAGYDIPGASYGNATVENCQTSCNNNNNCAGFAFGLNTCYPKTSSMYPKGSKQSNPAVNLYIRNTTPNIPPIGVQSTTNNIDSILYQNYINGGAMAKSYGLTNATSIQKQQLQQMQSKINLLSGQISNLTTRFNTDSQQLENQSHKNVQEIGNYLNNIENNNKQMNNYNNNNIENILDDSDIVVLQKNYDYLFWSIIATGIVLVTMNIK